MLAKDENILHENVKVHEKALVRRNFKVNLDKAENHIMSLQALNCRK